MSLVEEDVELRDLLAQTLEKNGCLAKIRAELRASIFLALDEDIKLSKQEPLKNLKVQSYLETPEGRAMFYLVREFLEFFNLQFTISVYDPESCLDNIGQYEGRHKIAKDLGLDNIEEHTVPLLQEVLKIAQTKSKLLDINLNLNNSTNGSFKDESSQIDSSYKKTESFNSVSNTTSNLQTSHENINKNDLFNTGNLNVTFDINSPTVNVALGSSRSSTVHGDSSVDKQSLHKISIEQNYSSENAELSPGKSIDIPNVSVISSRIDESNENSKSARENSVINLDANGIDTPKTNQNKNAKNKSRAFTKDSTDIDEDNTIADTSSIAEDGENFQTEEFQNNVPCKSPPSFGTEISMPQPSNISNISKPEVEKQKLSPQRPKPSLNSLSDLPPLPLNKSRVSSDILPSLYSKDLKNKSNLRELDKMFDMEAEYEEDFMYSNELPPNQPHSKGSTSGESLIDQKTNLDLMNIMNIKESKVAHKIISDAEKSPLKPVQTNCSNVVKKTDYNNKSSISEYPATESLNAAQKSTVL